MSKIKTLYYNKWLSLKEVDDYVFSHEERCRGIIVAVLPYRYKKNGEGREYMVRDEYNVAWDGMNVSSITGGFDEDDLTPEACAIRETYEEAGYSVPEHEAENLVVRLGTTRGSKSSDTVYHLFAIDVSGLERVEAPGDGSKSESMSSCRWVDVLPSDSQDPFLYAMFHRLQEKSKPEST